MPTPCDLLPAWLLDDGSTSDGGDSGSHVPPPFPPANLQVVSWDDGFTPSGCNNRQGRMVTNQPRSTPGAFRIVDAAVATETADLLYASAVASTVWGVFVPTRDLLPSTEEHLQQKRALLQQQDEQQMDKPAKATYRQALAQQAVQEFLISQCQETISKSDWQETHGVAVWVIASDCEDETQYHLDYAEMLRYETNVVFPPIYGATLHVSPMQNREALDEEEGEELQTTTTRLEGGGFYVNTSGLAHYQQYGYKTRLMDKPMTTDTLEHIAKAHKEEEGWQHVPYKYRRGILCDGVFPHFSGRVRSLTPHTKRVVVGFNLFPKEIGQFVEKFPEHSDAFNKYIKLSQTAVKKQQQEEGKNKQDKWSLESVKKNPKQAAFIKFLARKVREQQQKDHGTAT